MRASPPGPQLLVCGAQLLFLLLLLLLHVLPVCDAAPASCASLGGSCAASCSTATLATSDCLSGGGLVCCVSSIPAVQAGQLTHAEATAQLPFANTMCTTRALASSACATLEGVQGELVDELRSIFAGSTQCSTRILTEGTENVRRVGAAGACSAHAGRRLKVAVSATCASSFGASSRLTALDAIGACYTSNVRPSFQLCKSPASTTSWVAYYCAAVSSGACGSSVGHWSDALSNPLVRWSASSVEALAHAQEASQGDRVTTPSGAQACLDGRMGQMLAGRTSSTTTVGGLSSGSVPSGSRHNAGRAVRVDAYVGACPGTFGCHVNEFIRGSSWYEVSWLSPGTAAPAPAPTYSCSSADATTMFSAQTLQCFEDMPMHYWTSDYCALYTSPEPWRYIFSCLRQSEPAWSCFWVPGYNSACAYYAQNGYLQDTVGVAFCGVSYGTFVRNICSGFYSSGTRLVVAARTPALVTSCTTYTSDLQAASSESMTYACKGGGVAESYSSSNAIDYGTASADLRASANLEANVGGVDVTVVHPSDEKSNKAVVSGAVVLVLGVVATGAIVGAFFWLRSGQRPAVSASTYRARRPALAAGALVVLVISATSLNWAQTAPKAGRYASMSPEGACACADVGKACGAPGGMHAAAALDVLHLLGFAALLCVHRLLLSRHNATRAETATEGDGNRLPADSNTDSRPCDPPRRSDAAGQGATSLEPEEVTFSPLNVPPPPNDGQEEHSKTRRGGPVVHAVAVAAHPEQARDAPRSSVGEAMARLLDGVKRLVLGLVDRHPLVLLWGLPSAVAVLALLPLVIFMGVRDQCGASTLLPGQAGVLQAGAILRILEVVVLGALSLATFPWPPSAADGGAATGQTPEARQAQAQAPEAPRSALSQLAAVREVVLSTLDLKRRAAVCLVVAPWALASGASASWSFTTITLSHLSMYTSCACRAWSCSTTLGGHTAATAFFWIAVSLFIIFVWLRVCTESELFHHFVGPHVRATSVWRRATLSKLWRLRVGRALLSAAVGSLLLTLVIYLGVLMAASCRMDGLTVSYGLVFAVLLYVAMLVMLLQEWSHDVYGDGLELDEKQPSGGNPPPE